MAAYGSFISSTIISHFQTYHATGLSSISPSSPCIGYY
eukprot:CAMPEP_0172458632 /NCGR_PEP_ID=MMETSP1065-20121228/28471_1 /TAXON_ID=265537 /ORGANISM="Amphiprora paludosa, Strain CCMP125" /LENGTH=37 /DNA_ID= /DNA_START= /DNA_END= /DNA_ORIENTATION=